MAKILIGELNMLTIEYDNNAESMSDFSVQSVTKDIINTYNFNNNNMLYKTANGLVIQTFRLHVKNKLISHKEIIFKYQDQEIQLDKHGNLDEWPEGFCDEYEKVLIDLVD